MLFAAGFGTRMGALTRSTPKPLLRVAGRALLDHALDQTTGVARRVVNAHYLADQIEAHVAGTDVRVSVEAPDILDTGGGLRQALPMLGPDPVFTLNTDVIWTGPRAFDTLRAAWDPTRMDALLLCVPLARAIGRQGGGDFSFDAENRLLRGGDMVYTGAQILRTDDLPEIEDTAFSLNVLWNRMAAAGRLYGVLHPGHWCDLGRPEGIALAEQLLSESPA